MKLRVLSGAEEDLAQIALWYLEDQLTPQAAGRFAMEVDRVFEAIVKDPKRYPVVEDGLRVWPFRKFPYHVFYRYTANEIIVVAIKHTARDAGYLRKRT